MRGFFNISFCITGIQTDTQGTKNWHLPPPETNWLVSLKTIAGNGSLQWTIFSFDRMCFTITMTFEGVNNNFLTPSWAYNQRSVVSLACVPLYCKRRPEDTHPIENPGLLLFESSKVNKNMYSHWKMMSNFFPGKAKLFSFSSLFQKTVRGKLNNQILDQQVIWYGYTFFYYHYYYY